MNTVLLIVIGLGVLASIWLLKKIIKIIKKTKRLNILINQKKEDKNFVDTYDCRSRNYQQIVEGYACQHIPDNAKKWLDRERNYLNENASEYLDAKRRLYGEHYVLTC